MSTTEGIYISLDLRATQLKTSNIELDMKTHFMLAEIDFRIESILRIFDKLNNKIETQICTIIKDKLLHMENYTIWFLLTRKRQLRNLNYKLMIKYVYRNIKQYSTKGTLLIGQKRFFYK